MGVVAIGHSANGMAENLDRRLGHVLVVVGGARLAEILEHPGPLVAGFHVLFRGDFCQAAEFTEPVVRPCPSRGHRRVSPIVSRQ